MNELLKVSEVAERLGCSRPQVYRWVRELDMPAIRLGRAMYFTAEQIDEWLLDQTINHERTNGISCPETATGAPQEAPAPTTKYQSSRA